MDQFVFSVERLAGYSLGILAIITFVEAVLRYGFNSHIPDGFVIGQMMQGIAICWGISTATYADRHINVAILYEVVTKPTRRTFDVLAYTINLVFMTLFGAAMMFKVFDILKAGEYSNELRIPLWSGYIFASLGIVAAVGTALIRWWQIVIERKQPVFETESGDIHV